MFLRSSLLKCFCGRTYNKSTDLEEHRIARGHFSSHRCTSLCEHPSVVPHDGKIRECGCCGKACERLDIFQDHLIATGHCFCPDCDLVCPSQKSLETHRKTVIHASEFKCCDCNIFFKDVHALVAHMESSVHRKPLQERTSQKRRKGTSVGPKNTRCEECQQTFSSSESLQQHHDSVKHKPLSNLSCPIGTGCRGSFTSPSALLHHLESGKCKSGVNRSEVYRMVQSCDLEGTIHSQPKVTPSISSTLPDDTPSESSESWAISSDSGSEWSLLTPAPSEGSIEDSLEQWLLLEGSEVLLGGSVSFEAKAAPTLQCPLCPKKRKRFVNANALQQHIDSPFHSAKVYHCPKKLSLNCSGKNGEKEQVKYFSTLASLCQHLETGACKGGKQAFLQCVDLIQGRLDQLGFRGMRVLLPNVGE